MSVSALLFLAPYAFLCALSAVSLAIVYVGIPCARVRAWANTAARRVRDIFRGET